MTGSSRPSAASLVRLRPYSSSMEPSPGPWPPATSAPERTSAMAGRMRLSDEPAVSRSTALRTASPEMPMRVSASMATPLPSRTMPSSRCSVEM